MNINIALLGQVLAGWIVLATGLSAYLSVRKTQTPVLGSILGFVLAFIPPFSLLYLVVLVLKRDVKTASD
ncbi:hypothetical protein [Halopseudomonas maritima]|uniref:hypothetical protein n=1 Tax=Halopseudomonas maritima TaxID=2918528 RepID=UPI001EEB5052|nr:hypothetical protein [Halopseudomonas maritima]UJJ31945.1 hypothetical protein HV822_01855 [Halopseudomonas maritima]